MELGRGLPGAHSHGGHLEWYVVGVWALKDQSGCLQGGIDVLIVVGAHCALLGWQFLDPGW